MFLKHGFLFILILVGLLAISGLVIQAADHIDSPDTDESNLDINDLYVFSRGNNMVFAMTVSPILMPGSETNTAAFNPNGLYQFKLDVEQSDNVDSNDRAFLNAFPYLAQPN
ncbi:DUF4331 domain-containing protein [candidate division KSB1 bacterium]|nr:DUF4331 domain-containing protein [candidate division KSB1 bacterium]NIR72410.1 DUF4331 domain-containing protein [candidate division KSB1 bacterium]NIS26740.1 DUF4331 domain-containing protein [candidate division KSB1 bacterium]NIT73487.1 DUF4331 domain-containing protein [candidate division KSB1 bacterium]NIU27355.1 DUF4331 domain-containing protein [candidate division KSB1 bacterium]